MKNEIKNALLIVKDEVEYLSDMSIAANDIVSDELNEIREIIKKMEEKIL